MERHKVLVVDVSEAIRVLLTAFFSHAGFAVDSTASIDTALSKLRSLDFDVVVMDPACGSDGNGDGDGLTRMAKAFPDILARTVVIASAPHWPISQTVHAVIEKPFELDRLLEAAVSCSGSQHLRHT